MLNFCKKILLPIILLLSYTVSCCFIAFAKKAIAEQNNDLPRHDLAYAGTSLASTKSWKKSPPLIIEVNKGVMRPVSIAMNISSLDKSLTDRILGVIKNDLQSTSLFRAIPETAFMEELASINVQPQYKLWRIINAQYLLNAQVSVAEARVQITLVLYDVVSEKIIGNVSIQGSLKNLRKIAHIAANCIYEKITGESGYFDTKIMYVALSRARNSQKTYKIALMDQDGFGHRYLTNGATTVLTPRLAPNGRWFTFFAYKEKIVNGRRVPISASVYYGNIETGKISPLVQMDGITYAPRHSPDGRFLAFCLSRKGASSIWLLNLMTGEKKRLTRGACIDTSPSFSPDGQRIVFNSDRGGTQQLYIMNIDGSNVRRLSYDVGHRYASPVWSPRGDWIAFTKFRNGVFYIGIVRPDGSGERVLASGYMLEGPTWSPNGRIVMYAQQDYSRREKICSVDITGNNRHEISTPGDAIDPEWSAGTGKSR
ncbi:MAG: Tol-Pal system beta propeller repeat protein TolB [Holosporaceae bacterium]|jgi:TolB protein|nr:Tol-Pal system beta propeller repeat protein TolB [Holosporaceae bacterium]